MPRAEAASTSAVTACRLSHCISCRGAFSCGVFRMSQQVDMCSGASYWVNLANDLTAASLLLHVPGELPLDSLIQSTKSDAAAPPRSDMASLSAGMPLSSANHNRRSTNASRYEATVFGLHPLLRGR